MPERTDFFTSRDKFCKRSGSSKFVLAASLKAAKIIWACLAIAEDNSPKPWALSGSVSISSSVICPAINVWILLSADNTSPVRKSSLIISFLFSMRKLLNCW